MTRATLHTLAIALLAATTAGCGTSPAARFYTLNSAAEADDAAKVAYSVGVGPVSVPSSVDRPQFVLEVAPNQVDIDEFSRWAAPLDESIARAVAGNLSVLLGTPDVAVVPLASFNPDYRVSIDIQRFDSVRGDTVVVDAVWAVRQTAGKETRSGRTLARQPVKGDTSDALAAAHSRALARVSSDIASAIREIGHPMR